MDGSKKGISNIINLVGGFFIAVWMGLDSIMQLLIILMVLDILSGLIVAFTKKEISSQISWVGISKKAIIIIIVAGAQFAGDVANLQIGEISLGAMVAGFYAANEFISILENAAAVGIPIPKFLKDALQKLNPEKFEPSDPNGSRWNRPRAQG